MTIICDIETVAVDGAAEWVEPVEAAKNLRDPEKIAADIERRQRDQIERAGLYPWTARVVALGMLDTTYGAETIWVCRTEDDEADALRGFWRAVEDERFVKPIIGFNHRTFDLPVLLARSLLLGVPAPALNLDRYRTPHIDLMEKLTYYGAIPPRSLKWFARRFGLPVEDAISGADIAGLVAAQDWPAVAAHCRSDIRLTWELAKRLGTVRALTRAL